MLIYKLEMLRFHFNNNAITCIVVDGDPWFEGNEIATILGYTFPRYAIRDHVPEKFKKTLESLMLSSGRGVSPLPDHNDRIAMYINEPSLYSVGSHRFQCDPTMKGTYLGLEGMVRKFNHLVASISFIIRPMQVESLKPSESGFYAQELAT